MHAAARIPDANSLQDASSELSAYLTASGTDVESTPKMYTYFLYSYFQFLSVWYAPPKMLLSRPFPRFYVKQLMLQLRNYRFC